VQQIKERYNNRFTAPINIRRGGTEMSLYFVEFSQIGFANTLNRPIEGDEVMELNDLYE
jgi:hypothetical protein